MFPISCVPSDKKNFPTYHARADLRLPGAELRRAAAGDSGLLILARHSCTPLAPRDQAGATKRQ